MKNGGLKGGWIMAITISNEDLRLIKQPVVQCYSRFEVLDNDGIIIDSLEGVVSGGSSNIDANSDIRRTYSFTLIPTKNQSISISEKTHIWLNKAIRVKIGIQDLISKEQNKEDKIKWWSQGYFLYTEASSSYDASTNELQISSADFMVLFDGSRNGTLGQAQIIIPAYKEDSDTGEVLQYNYIRDAIIYTAGQLGRIKNFQVENIGEYKGLEEKNPDGYEEYRKANPTWNCVPYDLEFSSGDTVLDILTKLRDLYPNYEMFFDINNIFICQIKPSGYSDMVTLTNEQIQSILLSENTESVTTTFSEVKNMSEVWGEVIEADFYTESGVTYSNNVYIIPNSAYVDGTGTSEARYYNGDKFAFKVPVTNLDNPSMNIQSLGAIPIYDGENLNRLKAGVLKENRTYTFKIKRSYSNGVYSTRAIYMGQYQPHGMTVLLSQDRHDEMYTTNTGVTVEKYSPEYFYELYDVSPHALTRVINPDSPFAIEKIGEILEVENNENCITDDMALAQSNYNNFVSSRLTDSISITTLLIPFIDVNIKVEYKPFNSDETNQYIIDSVSHNFENGTTSIEMHRFYPLYSWI